MEQGPRQVLMFGLYGFSTIVNMLMIRGDLILNTAALAMGGLTIGEGTWMTYLTVPTLVLCGLALVIYRVVFKRELAQVRLAPSIREEVPPMTGREKLNLALILAVVVLWATESLHGVKGLYVVTVGTVLMFPLGMLRLKDFKSVNVKLLVFLTAAFSIGGVMKVSGAASIIFTRFTPLFPTSFGWGYVALVALTAMALHMVLGSNITTMSVVVPGILSIGAGVSSPEVLLFIIYVAVCGHYLLPFHHVVMLLGEGKAYYSGSHMMRFGAVMTVVLFGTVLLVYLSWWKLLGLV
ncbi:hypothetical protein SDC9_110790 [bioreactor metagenome]|uniref:Inner membrane protein YbhI n=1 Tax=bioreactor metagenome TaxID=1076179 RepID=A0A645BFJ8_9ZZZZ